MAIRKKESREKDRIKKVNKDQREKRKAEGKTSKRKQEAKEVCQKKKSGNRQKKSAVQKKPAESFQDIIDWDETRVDEPAIIERIPNFPCHSQSVQRAVKLVSEASTQVYGEDARHKWILTVNR